MVAAVLSNSWASNPQNNPTAFNLTGSSSTPHLETQRSEHIEFIGCGSVSTVLILNHLPYSQQQMEQLATELFSIAGDVRCRALIIDFSELSLVPSAMLSRLILLQRRMHKKSAALILFGMCPEVREIFRWTKLDRFFEIKGPMEIKVGA